MAEQANVPKAPIMPVLLADPGLNAGACARVLVTCLSAQVGRDHSSGRLRGDAAIEIVSSNAECRADRGQRTPRYG
jgi:hypothetical protein